jgi:glucans biosynthesis protein
VPVLPDNLSNGPSRRDVLALGASFAALMASTRVKAQAQAPQAILQAIAGDGQRFEPGLVVEVARQLARRPFSPPPGDLPDPFANLAFEQYAAIRALPGSQIWAEGRGISVEPLHRGFVYTNQVGLFLVEDGTVRRVAYDRSRFDYGKLNVPPNVPDLGFSGVRLHSTFGNSHTVQPSSVRWPAARTTASSPAPSP